MKTKFAITSLLSLCCLCGFGQVTIVECYTKAQTNYPLINQYDLVSKTQHYNLANANKGYLPQLLFSAKATHQSEVTQIPMPGIEGLSKEQYGATVEVSQTIWDGGAIESRKGVIRSEAQVEKMKTQVNLYSINERVNQLYFGILLFDAKLQQNELLRSELAQSYEKVLSFVQNGVANQADLDAVKVEQIAAQQSESELTHNKKAYLNMLSTLIGEQLSDDVVLVRPATQLPSSLSVERPELGLYDAQVEALHASRREINASLKPKLGAFVTGGYGRPALNMLSNNPSSYYIAGVRLSWSIGNLYTNKSRKRALETQSLSIENQRETFLFNTNIDLSRKRSDIQRCFDRLTYDDQIIALRGSIKRSSQSKVANGTMSAIDLMRDVVGEDMARQEKILHEIELLLAIYNLKYVTNTCCLN